MAEIHLPPPMPIDPGTTAIDGDRRVGRSARRARQKVRAVLVRSVVRERRLGRLLERELGPVAMVLHHRRTLSGDRIDHLVVAASGVWLIEARHESGKVVRRERRRAQRGGQAWLRIRGGPQIDLLESHDATPVVRGHLERIGFEWLDVRAVVCLTNARWGPLRRPFAVDGTLVTWGRALVDTIGVPGPLGPGDMRAVAVELGARLCVAS